MAKRSFKYVGDPYDNFSGEAVTEVMGMRFPKGEVVEVPEPKDENDTEARDRLRKIEGNSHFIDMSDKDAQKAVSDQQKAIDKREADEAKAAEEQRKRDEADEQQRQKALAKQLKDNPQAATAATAPRAPGTQSPPVIADPFGGRTVEQRTQAEDHTKAGKTKG